MITANVPQILDSGWLRGEMSLARGVGLAELRSNPDGGGEFISFTSSSHACLDLERVLAL